MQADETTMTTATMNLTGTQMADEKSPVSVFGDALSSLAVVLEIHMFIQDQERQFKQT